MSKRYLLASALLLIGACAGPPYPGTQPLGTVSGRVLSWPCAPVERAESPCAGRPVPGIHLEFSRNGNLMGTAVTDSSGAYSIQLLPGTYTVMLKDVRLMRSSNQVTVRAGQVTTADFTFDNGIRMPAAPNG